MPSNTRGKIKDKLVAIHKNCDWIKQHCEDCHVMIGEKHEGLTEAFNAIAKVATQLDLLAQGIYSKV